MGQKAFSAAAIGDDHSARGYLYVILGGEEYDSVTRFLLGSYILRLGVRTMILTLIGAAVIALCILLTYRYAHRVSRKIGHTGMMVVVRLSAFIMLCIGVGISWDGIKSLLAEIGIHG